MYPFACVAALPVGAITKTVLPVTPCSAYLCGNSVIIASIVKDLSVPAVPAIIIEFGIYIFGNELIL